MLESPWHPPRPSTSSRRRVSGTLAGPIGVELFERGSVEIGTTVVPRLSVLAEPSPHLRFVPFSARVLTLHTAQHRFTGEGGEGESKPG